MWNFLKLQRKVSLFTREWIEIFIKNRLCDFCFVSLFTREWIEIIQCMLLLRLLERLPLYEGVDWNFFCTTCDCLLQRLPLYEGVDWNRVFWKSDWKRRESLPLYEGVDWNLQWLLRIIRHYRLPLYEGVDWNVNFMNQPRGTSLSPSLRGSGLKSPILEFIKQAESLPLYEGVDWNRLCAWCTAAFLCLPLYEGVDWNFYIREIVNGFYVSLFTREWIEISWASFVNFASDSLPLYEGVDWNFSARPAKKSLKMSPSLRGSGLKSARVQLFHLTKTESPSLRGSGLKCPKRNICRNCKESPSLRGSGLKLISASCNL